MPSDSETIETYSLLSSSSENEEDNPKPAVGALQMVKAENSDEDGEYWKKALLARDLDTLHTCTLMMVSNIPPSQRLQFSQNITDSLTGIKEIVLNGIKLEDSTASTMLGWKNALLARNLDLIETSQHIIMMDIPSGLREQLGRTIEAALHDVERVIQNGEGLADHLIHCTEADTVPTCKQKDDSEKQPANASPLKPSKPTGQSKRFKKTKVYRGPLPIPDAPQSAETIRALVKKGICPICNRRLPGQFAKCSACKIFAVRLKERLHLGYYLNCDHKDFSGGVACRACRFHLFNLMSEEGQWG